METVQAERGSLNETRVVRGAAAVNTGAAIAVKVGAVGGLHTIEIYAGDELTLLDMSTKFTSLIRVAAAVGVTVKVIRAPTKLVAVTVPAVNPLASNTLTEGMRLSARSKSAVTTVGHPSTKLRGPKVLVT